jgi:hypothetical protein
MGFGVPMTLAGALPAFLAGTAFVVFVVAAVFLAGALVIAFFAVAIGFLIAVD